MDRNLGLSTKRQPFIVLDVGGQSFKISRHSLERYPDSLLAKMMREFPELVDNGEPLFIDRNPKLFHWILEIYRDGDYVSCFPSIRREFLQEELDFYQLPNMERLRLAKSFPSILSREETKRQLMQQILHEVEASGLQGMFSWDFYIYFVIERGRPQTERRVCVRVPRGMRSHSLYYTEGEHKDFFAAMQCRNGNPQHINQQLIYPSCQSHSNYAVPTDVRDIVQLLQSPAAERGMQAMIQSYNQPMGDGDVHVLNCVRLRYATS